MNVKAVLCRFVFVRGKQLEPVEVGVEVGEVYGVTVTHAGAVHQCTVVVDGTSTVDDFVVPVVIDIAHREVVVTLSVGTFAVGRRVVYPALGEVGAVEVISYEYGAGVISAAHDEARVNAVEVSDAGQETVYPVAVTVAPRAYASAGRVVRDGSHFGSRFTVEHGEVFRA